MPVAGYPAVHVSEQRVTLVNRPILRCATPSSRFTPHATRPHRPMPADAAGRAMVFGPLDRAAGWLVGSPVREAP